MDISELDFKRAIEMANKAGQRGNEVNVLYIPPTSATEINGQFVVDEYQLTATGERAL